MDNVLTKSGQFRTIRPRYPSKQCKFCSCSNCFSKIYVCSDYFLFNKDISKSTTSCNEYSRRSHSIKSSNISNSTTSHPESILSVSSHRLVIDQNTSHTCNISKSSK